MPKKPSPKPSAKALDYFGMPSQAELQRAGVISGAISKIISDDEAIAAFHHKMVRHGICCRYELALATASDKKAFANFAKDERIKALHRQPRRPSDTLQCLFQATYSDPKKASKYYKRIEPLWIKRCSAREALVFLEKYGVSKPSPKASPTLRGTRHGQAAADTPAKQNKTSNKAAGGGGNNARSSPPVINNDDPPGGSFLCWEGETTANQFYDLRVKIVDHVGEATIFELFDVSPARVQ